MLVVLSSILSACIVAYAGPVSFVSFAVPHLVKNLFGHHKACLDDSGLLSGRKCILPVLRLAG